jgi:hypothetical protein
MCQTPQSFPYSKDLTRALLELHESCLSIFCLYPRHLGTSVVRGLATASKNATPRLDSEQGDEFVNPAKARIAAHSATEHGGIS